MPGAVHLPNALVAEQAERLLDKNGFEVETWQGREQRPEADPLTAPTDSDDCGC
ncbi:hypothetical protein [Streptomyces sp. NPDC056883]|uniref:hypothetical protein n=1 Tax=Streptomyces sp. NPDC056883 TaxID=3345959 RepID=UPI0036B4D51D